MIKRVQLRNILSHERTSIELRPGLTAIIGPNGAGKSTIVDSIVYALFTIGKGSALRGTSKRDLLRRGTVEGEIYVEFELGGKVYGVRRVLSTVRVEEAYLYELTDDKQRLLASGVNNVYEKLKELLHIDNPEIVRYTIIARQDELTKLIDLRPSERKEMILKLFGLEELEKARDTLRKLAKKISEVRGELNRISLEISKIQKRIEELEKTKTRYEEEIKKKSRELEALRDTVNRYKLAQTYIQRYLIIRESIKRIERIKEIDEELRKIYELLRVSPRIKRFDVVKAGTLIDELKRIESRYKELYLELSQVENDIIKMLKSLGIDKVEGLDNVVKRVDEEYNKLNKDYASIETELNILRESRKVVSESSNCPVCRRPLDRDLRKNLVKELEDRIRVLEIELKEISTRLEQLRRCRDSIERLYRVYLELRANINEYDERLKRLYVELEPMTKEISELLSLIRSHPILSICLQRYSEDEVKVIDCAQSMIINAETKAISLEEEKRRLVEGLDQLNEAELRKELEIIQASIRALGIELDAIDLSTFEERLRGLESKLIEKERELASLEERLKSLDEELNRLRSELENLRAEYNEKKKLVDALPFIEYIQDKVLGKDGLLAKHLIANVRSLVERYCNEILKNFGLDLRIEITPDFDIRVRSSLGEVSVKSISGGEKTAIAIALRMALAYTMMGRAPSFFILDEPTAHLDSERRRILFDMIRRLSEKLPQVIVVTHDEDVVDIADHVLEVVKEGTRSIVRYVSKVEKL